MSRLEELIQQLCPDGVEYKRLNTVCSIFDGTHSTPNYKSEGVKFVSVENINNLYETKKYISFEDYNTYKVKPQIDDILMTRIGSIGVCTVVDQKEPLAYYVSLALLRPDTTVLNSKYLKYAIESLHGRKELRKRTLVNAVPIKINKDDIGKITVPIPPMEVQQEIVRILDQFTELIAELMEKLTAELTARKKQYEYYRDELLTQCNTQKVELRQVVKKSCSGATPAKGHSEYYENGTIPWLRTQDVRFNEIYKIDSFITEEAVKQTAAKWIPENCVIVAISGASAGRCAINKIKTTTNQHCLNMEIDESKALYKYVYYCVASQYQELLSRKQGARGDLNSSLILGLQIPLPTLEEQRRIVSILDRFDALCNDLTSGLPAEIEARRKQYEYYRDKLLTFKKKASDSFRGE